MNVLDILADLNIPFWRHGEHHHVSANFVGIDCPWCSPGSLAVRMGISLSGRVATCWVCGPHKTGASLAEASGYPLTNVLSLLGGVEGFEALRRPRGRLKLPAGLGALLPQHRRYLRGRGIDPDAAETLWGAKGLGTGGRPAWSVFVPIRDGDETVSWTCRRLYPGDGMRYHNARPDEEALPAKSILYGAELARHAVLVVEGPLDCWRVGPGCVALMGLNCTGAQMAALMRHPVRYICLDVDAPGESKRRQVAQHLSMLPGGKTFGVTLETGKDPGEASEAEVRQLRRLLK